MSENPLNAGSGTVSRSVTADIREYVEAFKTSANRSRYAVFVVLVVTVLLLVADHNLHRDNWPRRRIRTWYTYARAADAKYDQVQDQRPNLAVPENIVDGDPLRLAALREEYAKQFVGRALFNASPLPGVSIDANDMGLVGGIALTMLMLVLVFCLAREHENLYLALFKVRQIAKDEGVKAHRGDSCANLLYHALAMNQVLGAPPTLARWQKRGVLNHFWFFLFAPFIVHFSIVWTSWKTSHVGEAYGVTRVEQMAMPTVLTCIIGALCVAAALQSRAMALRWKRMFFAINPHLRHVEQMDVLEWLKVRRPSADETAARQVAAEIVQHLSLETLKQAEAVIVPVVERPVKLPITRSDMRRVTLEIVKRGRAVAAVDSVMKNLGRPDGTGYFTVEKSHLDGETWSTTGKWVFRLHALKRGLTRH